MTREEFEAGYAERSKIPREYLHSQGMEARPCNCGEEGCQGWQMTTAFQRRGEEIGARRALEETREREAQ